MASTLKRFAIWTGGLLLLLFACVVFRIWYDFRSYRITHQREAARLIAEFHHRFNDRDLAAICRDAYRCSDLPGLRQDWQRLLDDTRNRGGMFRSVVQSDINVYVEPPSVWANVDSSFGKGELREIFMMKDYEGGLKIFTYKTVTKEEATP
jgi:hypothetical protein